MKALHLLPVRTGGAAENMALDFLLLQRAEPALYFRHYEWRTPAFTFGYSQKIGFVREQLPAGETFDLCRRPTGGGIVDHRNDWTYTLVVSRGHALYDDRATAAYRIVHECLAATLGPPAVVKLECDGCADGPTVCFQRAELYDVVNSATGAKIAGAAMKRNKHGLLFQGSIEKSAIGAVEWEVFAEKFPAELGRVLHAEPQESPWPELHEDEVSGLIEQYSSPEWIEYR